MNLSSVTCIYVLPTVYAIMIFLQVNFSSVASSRKKQRNIYNIEVRPIKLSQPKGLGWDGLSKRKELKYEENTIICQVDVERDQIVVLVC